MVYGGKIYETDGANAVAVHEAVDVRPLSPVPHAPSLRIFRSDFQGLDAEEPQYFYANPSGLFGASQIINTPESIVEIGVLPMMAAVLVADGYRVDLEDAEDLILGYTILTLLVAPGELRSERASCAIGRSHDLGGVIGPVLTTPDELEDEVQTAERGRRYALDAVLRVNGVERERGNTLDLPFTFAQAISAVSQTTNLRTGDVFALGPVAEPDEDPVRLEPGDEVQLAIGKLGALSLKLGNPL